MRCELAVFALLIAGAAHAQNRAPQMTWQGYVAGSATLFVQGDRVDVQGRNTGSIDRPKFHFNAPLPAQRVQGSIQVRRGPGKVHIAEQPEPGNEYTLVVQVDPPGDGHEFYIIDFFWGASEQTPPGTRARAEGHGEMTWVGEVDGEAVIEIRGGRAVARAVSGRKVRGAKAQFTGRISPDMEAQIVEAKGRGRIELVEQAGTNGRDVVTVRILDDQPGASRYSFRLAWNREPQQPSAPETAKPSANP